MHRIRAGVPLGAALILAAFSLIPAAAETQSIVISEAWARATPPTATNGAAYLTIANNGTADDSLLSIATPAASMAMLHMTSNAGGIMRMEAVETAPIKAGRSLVMKPGGTHIMLTSLTQPLKAGDSFHLTLIFQKAGPLDALVTVRTAAPAAGHDMPGMAMPEAKP